MKTKKTQQQNATKDSPQSPQAVLYDSSSDEDASYSSHEGAETVSSSAKAGGAKEEIAKAEGVLRSNSSYVSLGGGGSGQMLTKRMKDDTLDH
jgi:hypothetical protein